MNLMPLIGGETIGDARQVIVVMGEACRAALAAETGRIVVGFSGGAAAVTLADWTPLAGRNVVIWPDANDQGAAAANAIGETISRIGSTARIVDVFGEAMPNGWNAEAAIRDGWDRSRLDAFARANVKPYPLSIQMPQPAVVMPAQPKIARDDFPGGTPRQPYEAETPEQGQLVRMIPSHHVVWGSEVEIAGILARELSADRGGHIVWAEGHFWEFGRTQWSEIPEQRMRLMVHQFDGAHVGPKGTPLKVGKRTIDGALNELSSILGKQDFFERTTIGINAANGVITFDDTGSPSIKPHSADDRFRFTIPADFSAHHDMEPPDGSHLHHLLSGAFRDDEDAQAKQHLVGEMLGAAALGLATKLPQPKAFVFLGETASNGKSTVARLLSCLLPAGSVSSISPAAFGDERRIINLAGKAANVADELSASAIAGEAFKAAVTGDALEGRDLYRSAVTFRPRALHCFTTNTLPRFNGGLDRGLQRRLVVVRFNRTIPENEIIPDIIEKIREDELHLVLQFAVAGAQRLIRNKAYTIPGSSKEALQSWLMLDPVQEWLTLQTVKIEEEPAGGWMATSKLYAAFRAWAMEEGHSERFLPPVNTFSQRLKASGVPIVRRSTGSVAAGIRLASFGW